MATENLMVFAYLAPMVAILALFWSVARRLGHIESEVTQLRKENSRLESELLALRTLLSMLVDSRTKAG
jgi:hypothetical protein